MAKLGGYKLIDFKEEDISRTKIIDGLYDEIKETDKRIVACNFIINGQKFKETSLGVRYNSDGDCYLTNANLTIIIFKNNNGVRGEQSIYSNGVVTDSASFGDVAVYHNDDEETIVDGQGSSHLQGFSSINVSDLPTTDPHYDGMVWNDNGVLKVSQG